MLRFLIGTVIALGLAWALFLVMLVLLRPKRMSLAEAKRIVPDTVRLLRSLARDPALPKGVRRRLSLVVIYLALPIDLVPELPLEQLGVGLPHRHQGRFAGLEAGGEKRNGDGEELHWIGVDQRLVPEFQAHIDVDFACCHCCLFGQLQTRV